MLYIGFKILAYVRTSFNIPTFNLTLTINTINLYNLFSVSFLLSANDILKRLLLIDIMSQDTLCDVRSWTSYEFDDEKESKFQTIIQSFDQQVLIEACKEVRESSDINIDCVIQPHWAMGTRNLILEAKFSDGIRWVLKINMIDESDQTINGDKIYKTFQQEYTAMEFIRFVSVTSKQTFSILIRIVSIQSSQFLLPTSS